MRSECCAFCLNCDTKSSMYCLIGSMLVSSSKCCVFVSLLHPVAMRSAVFCIVCSMCVLVYDMVGDPMVLPYSSVVLVIVVYVYSNVLFKLH